MNVSLKSLLGLGRFAVLSASSLVVFTGASFANTIHVDNASFEQTLTATSSEFGDRYSSQQVTGWTSTGYNFVFLPGTADTTGAASEYGPGRQLWGPGNGANNGLSASPDGGNFLALDGAYAQGPVSQTISGFKAGDQVTVSFWFAGAQQYGYKGETTEQLLVKLGQQQLATEILTDPEHGFTGWKHESLSFTATGTSEVLSFLAAGTPAGEPPFSLLDGVSVTSASPVPEPSSLILLGSGLAGAAGLLRRHMKK